MLTSQVERLLDIVLLNRYRDRYRHSSDQCVRSRSERRPVHDPSNVDTLTVRSVGNFVWMIVATLCVKLGGTQQYQISLVLTIPLPSIILSPILFLPESPRRLLRSQEEKARRPLQRIRPSFASATCIEDELLERKAAIDEEKRQARGSAPRDIIKNHVDRRRAPFRCR